MSGKASRNKGATFERLIRNFLATRLNREIPNPAASGFSGADAVVGPFAVECKNQARWRLPDWWKQTLEQAESDKAFPVMVVKRPGVAAPEKQWAIMDVETLARLIEWIDEFE